MNHPAPLITAENQPPDHASDLMTVQEAADYLGVPFPTIYYLIQTRRIPAFQFANRWRIKRSFLETGMPARPIIGDAIGETV